MSDSEMIILNTFSLSEMDESEPVQDSDKETDSNLEEFIQEQLPISDPIPGPSRRRVSEPVTDSKRVSQLYSQIKILTEENSDLKLQLFSFRKAELPGKINEIIELKDLCKKLLNAKRYAEETCKDALSINETTQKELQAVRKEKELFQKQLALSRKEVKVLSSENDSIKDALASQKLDLDKQASKIEELQRIKSETETDLQSKLNAALATIEAEKLKFEILNQKLERVKLENCELGEKLKYSETLVETLQNEKQQWETELIGKNQEINSVKSELKSWWQASSVTFNRLVGESKNIEANDDQPDVIIASNEPPRLQVSIGLESVRVTRSASSSRESVKRVNKGKRLNGNEPGGTKRAKKTFIRNQKKYKRRNVVRAASVSNEHAHDCLSVTMSSSSSN